MASSSRFSSTARSSCFEASRRSAASDSSCSLSRPRFSSRPRSCAWMPASRCRSSPARLSKRDGLVAFELLANRVFRALRGQRRFDFVGDRVALAAQHVGPGAFQRPLAKLLLVLDADLDEQLAAAMFQPADRLFVFALADADVAAPRGGWRRGARRPPAAGRPPRQVRATGSTDRPTPATRRRRRQAARSAPRTNPIPACRRASSSRRCARRRCVSAIQSPRSISRRTCFGAMRFRQSGRRQGLAPATPRGLERLLRLVHAASGGVGLLLGRGAAGVQRREFLQGRQTRSPPPEAG